MLKRIGSGDPCWCGSRKPYGQCHQEFDRKVSRARFMGHEVPSHKIIKTPEQIQGIRESGKLNVAVLDYVAERIRAGSQRRRSTSGCMIIQQSTEGSRLLWAMRASPKASAPPLTPRCATGSPSEDVVLKEGDIINVDVSTILHGYYSDSSRMFMIGDVGPEKEKLVRVAREAVEKGLQEVKPWGYLGDMGQAVHDHVKKHGYTVVEDVGGHGVGLEFHEDPFVSYVTRRGTEMLMAPGMIFTIEPMVNMGGDEIFVDDGNGWTIYTEDGKPSAQWEIMVLVTEDGHEVLAW